MTQPLNENQNTVANETTTASSSEASENPVVSESVIINTGPSLEDVITTVVTYIVNVGSISIVIQPLNETDWDQVYRTQQQINFGLSQVGTLESRANGLSSRWGVPIPPEVTLSSENTGSGGSQNASQSASHGTTMTIG